MFRKSESVRRVRGSPHTPPGHAAKTWRESKQKIDMSMWQIRYFKLSEWKVPGGGMWQVTWLVIEWPPFNRCKHSLNSSIKKIIIRIRIIHNPWWRRTIFPIRTSAFEPNHTCGTEAFFQGLLADCTLQQTESFPASPKSDLRSCRTHHVPPSRKRKKKYLRKPLQQNALISRTYNIHWLSNSFIQMALFF